MKLGKAIKKMRGRRGFTQQELAERAGITRAYLSQIEGEKKKPTLETVEKIGKALQMPPQVLLFFSLSEEDIPEQRKEAYEGMYKTMKGLLEQTILQEDHA